MNRFYPIIAVAALMFIAVPTFMSDCSESSPGEPFGIVCLYIDDELVTTCDTENCVEVVESLYTYKEGYELVGWTDDPASGRLVDLANLPPLDISLYAVYEPVPEPGWDVDWQSLAIFFGFSLALVLLGLVYLKFLS